MKGRSLRVAALLLFAMGTGQAVQAGYIQAKARLAQLLIRKAWAEARTQGSSPRPWPWADTTPVARLRAPADGGDLMVLEGGSGRTLAFGPGHVTGTARPGGPGNVVLGGHRDTHFRFLKDLRRGDLLILESARRKTEEYVVSSTRVVDRLEGQVQGDYGDDRLTLITCFPFDAVRPGGPDRYVVVAIRVEAGDLAGAGSVRPTAEKNAFRPRPAP